MTAHREGAPVVDVVAPGDAQADEADRGRGPVVVGRSVVELRQELGPGLAGGVDLIDLIGGQGVAGGRPWLGDGTDDVVAHQNGIPSDADAGTSSGQMGRPTGGSNASSSR